MQNVCMIIDPKLSINYLSNVVFLRFYILAVFSNEQIFAIKYITVYVVNNSLCTIITEFTLPLLTFR